MQQQVLLQQPKAPKRPGVSEGQCGMMLITGKFCVPEKDAAQELCIATELIKVSLLYISKLNNNVLNK